MSQDFTPSDKNRFDKNYEEWLRTNKPGGSSGHWPVYADAWFYWQVKFGGWSLEIKHDQYPQSATFSTLTGKTKGFIANMTMEIYGAKIDRILFWKEGNMLKKGRWVAAFED